MLSTAHLRLTRCLVATITTFPLTEAAEWCARRAADPSEFGRGADRLAGLRAQTVATRIVQVRVRHDVFAVRGTPAPVSAMVGLTVRANAFAGFRILIVVGPAIACADTIRAVGIRPLALRATHRADAVTRGLVEDVRFRTLDRAAFRVGITVLADLVFGSTPLRNPAVFQGVGRRPLAEPAQAEARTIVRRRDGTATDHRQRPTDRGAGKRAQKLPA